MKKMMFSVRDRVTGKSYPPFLAFNIADARRMMASDLATKPDSIPGSNFGDKECFVLGHFFEDTGIIEALPKPEFAFEMASLLDDVYTTVRNHVAHLNPNGVK